MTKKNWPNHQHSNMMSCQSRQCAMHRAAVWCTDVHSLGTFHPSIVYMFFTSSTACCTTEQDMTSCSHKNCICCSSLIVKLLFYRVILRSDEVRRWNQISKPFEIVWSCRCPRTPPSAVSLRSVSSPHHFLTLCLQTLSTHLTCQVHSISDENHALSLSLTLPHICPDQCLTPVIKL